MSFRDRYDELFGPSDPYEPLDMGPFGQAVPKRSALPTSATDTMPDDPLYTPDLSPRKGGGDSGFLENMSRQFGAGVVQTGEMVLGGAEYVARQNSLLDGIVADTIYSGRSGLAGVREDILAGINQEDLAKAAREWTTLDPNSTIWQGGPLEFVESVLYKASNALPATLATLYPPIKLAKMGLSTQAIVAMGASEGVLSMGGIANQIADEILAQPAEQLIQDSPRFAELLEQYQGDADAAKRDLIKEAQGFAPLIGGAAVAGISSVAGRYFVPVFEKEGGAALGRRVAQGFAAEAPAEGSQGAVEQFTQNYAARIYDADRQLSEGVAEAFVGEGVIGGLMGAGFGGAFGERPATPRPPVDPNARPDLTEQQNLPGIEPGGPATTLPDELDQPTEEPVQDLLAQIDDLVSEGTKRNGVYIVPGTDERTVAWIAENLPDALTFVRNVDGKGGHLITKSAQLGYEAQRRIAEGASSQQVIGQILGIGRGKPTNPNSRVVQLLAEDGSVARESMVANQQEAEALGVAWSKEKGNKGLRVTVLTPQQAIERRQQLRNFDLPGGDVQIQEDLFDNRAARGTDAVAVPPPPSQQPPGQMELPLVQKRAGVGPQSIAEEGVGPVVPPEEGVTHAWDAYDDQEVADRQFGMNFGRIVDTITTSRETKVPTPDIAVQVLDKGEVVETHLFGNQEAADEAAEELTAQFPDFQIRVAPHTRTVRQQQTRQRRERASTKPIEPVYEQPVEDEIRDDIRATVPFEERDEAYNAVKGSRSVQQASEKLLGQAAAARAEEEASMIGGFYNPDMLEFNNPEYEQAYRAAWKKKNTKEMGKIRQIDKPKVRKTKSESLLKAATKVSPATRSELRNRIAREAEVEPGPRAPGTATPQRGVDEDYLGEFKGGTREKIDNLANYVVRNKKKSDKEWTEEEFTNAREAYARRDELKKQYPKRQIDVQVKGTRALDEEFERAVAFREGREAESKDEAEAVKTNVTEQTAEEEAESMELTGKLSFGEEEKADRAKLADVATTARVKRSWYTTPGRKLKFIRREAEHYRRRATGQKSVKAATVRRSAAASRVKQKPGESEQEFNKRVKQTEKGKKFDTQPLTVENYTLDESVQGRVERIAKAKQVRKELNAAIAKANRFLRSIKNTKVRGEFGLSDAYIDKVADNFLYARNYLEQLIQFGRSIQAAKNNSPASIKLAEGVRDMLAAVDGMDIDVFAVKWGDVARKNEFDDLANLKNTSLSAMRDQGKRVKDAEKRNREVLSQKQMREWAESMKGDKLYESLLQPLLQKMSQYVLDTVNGLNTMPYIPSPMEVSEVRFALNMNKDRADFDPIRKQLKEVGFEFDENNNVVSFLASENYLGARYNAMFKGVPEKTPGEIARVAETIDLRAQQRQARIEEAQRKGQAPAPEDIPPTIVPVNDRVHLLDTSLDSSEQTVEQAMANLTHNKKVLAGKAKAKVQTREVSPGLLTIDAVNGLIERFKRATAPAKTTWSGLKRHEARFIRGLKQLGVWRQTSPSTGVIDIAGVKSKTYRLVAPRFATMYRADARAYIQKIASFPIPKEMMADVRAARKDTEAVAGLNKFLDEAAIELFNEAAGPVKYDAEYTGVAARLGDMMLDGKISGTDVVNAILEIAPGNSFYAGLARRLQAQDMADVTVEFGEEADFPKGQFGKYQRGKKRVLINRDALAMHKLNSDEVLGARVVHTLTHELVHHQTHNAIDSNPTLRRHFEGLQARARQVWQKRVGKSLPYGLKVLSNSQNEVHEFVAEAFSNPEFQTFLKETAQAPQTLGDLWSQFVEAVRRALGMAPREVKHNLFDAILMTEDVLFDDAGFGGSVAQGDLYMTGEAVIDNISTHVQGKLGESWGWLKNAGRNLMTFEQLHDTYAKYFTDGSFSNYMDAWKRRNAAISQKMKAGERLSVRWTELESNPETAKYATEISEIGTAATIDKLTPSKQLTAKERAEVSRVRLAKYDELRARFLAMPTVAQNLYQDLRTYYRDAQAEEANLLLDAALRGVLTKGKGAPMTTEQYRAKFPREVIEKLSAKEDIAAALKEIIPEEHLGDLVKQVQRMASLRSISYGDYFPLMRYGDYTVYKEVPRPDQFFDDEGAARAERARLLEDDPTLDIGIFEKDGKTVMRVTEKEFWMFENKTKAQEKANELGVTVEARLPRDGNGTAISSNAELTSILNTLAGNPAAQAAIKNHYLKSLSDQSFRKHELKRKNRKGVDYQLQHRNLANYLKQSAYYRAQLEHGWRMGEALEDMRVFTRGRPDNDQISTEQLQQVYKNVVARDTMTNDPSELNKWVSKGVNVTQFMMLTSPSYWMINATQPWLVTLPIMGGKYGFGNSAAALKHAMSLVKAPLTKEAFESWFGMKALTKDKAAVEKAFNVVDQLIDHIKKSGDPRAAEYATLIDNLRDQNIVDINVLTELRQIANGVESQWGTKVLDASRILAHITEVSNRTMTAIAAYNLAKNNGESTEAATKYAADMVSQTQFNYSSENKPPLFQKGGPLKWAAPLMFQFMQWPQHMYALLIRNFHGAFVNGDLTAAEKAAYRKSLVGLLGTHAAVGGVVGMALQPIKMAFGMLMMAFGDDREPYTFANAMNGRTFDNLVAEIMSELFGDKVGRALSHGLPTLLGTDLSARMSMGTLYFVDMRGDTAESILGSVVASFGGATLNQAMNWGNAIGKVADGDIYRGVEQSMPKILRDVLRANRYYNEGLVNNAGDTVINSKDFSFYETFLQGIGFSPDEVSKFYSGQAAIKGAQGYARDRREALIRRFVEEGTSSGVLKDVLEFNRSYPSLRITRSTLIRGARIQVEREGRYRREGANIDAKEARDFSRYGDPYR